VHVTYYDYYCSRRPEQSNSVYDVVKA